MSIQKFVIIHGKTNNWYCLFLYNVKNKKYINISIEEVQNALCESLGKILILNRNFL